MEEKLELLLKQVKDYLYPLNPVENKRERKEEALNNYRTPTSEDSFIYRIENSNKYIKCNTDFGADVRRLFKKCKEFKVFETKNDFALRIILYPYIQFICPKTIYRLEQNIALSFPPGVEPNIFRQALSTFLEIPIQNTIDVHKYSYKLWHKRVQDYGNTIESYDEIVLDILSNIQKILSSPKNGSDTNAKTNFTRKADELFGTKDIDRLIAKPFIVDALNDLEWVLHSGQKFDMLSLYPHPNEFDKEHFPQNIILDSDNDLEDLGKKLKLIHQEIYPTEKYINFAKRIGLDSKLTRDLLDNRKISDYIRVSFDAINQKFDFYPHFLSDISFSELCDLFSISKEIEAILIKRKDSVESFCNYSGISLEHGFYYAVLKTIPYYVCNYERLPDLPNILTSPNYINTQHYYLKRFDELLWDAKEYTGLSSIMPLFVNSTCFMPFTAQYMESYLKLSNLMDNQSFSNCFLIENSKEKEILCQFLQIKSNEYNVFLKKRKIPKILGIYLIKNYFTPLFVDGYYYEPKPYRHTTKKNPEELFKYLQCEWSLLLALSNIQLDYKSKLIEYFNNPLGERTPQIMRSLSSNRSHIICLNKFVQSDLTQRENNILDAVYPRKIKYVNPFAKDEADIWTEIDQEGIDGKYFEKYLYWEIDLDEEDYIACLTISSAPILSEKETGLFCKNDIFLCADDVPWHSWADYIWSVTFKGNVEPLSMAFWFSNCVNLKDISWGESKVVNSEEIFVPHSDTSNCEDMSFLFAGCHSLTSIDLSNFDTSKCKNMSAMFEGCGLKSIDVSHFDTSKCVDMSHMFASCSVESLNLETFDMQCVEDVQSMFGGCYDLKGISFPDSFITQKIKSLNGLFSCCFSLQSINFDSFNTTNVKYMAGMFYACSALTEIDLTGLDFGNIVSTSEMFLECHNLENVKFPNGCFKQFENMTRMFTECWNLSELDLSSFNTADNIPVIQMFADCKNLKSLKIPNFGMPSWRDITNMFKGCESLNPSYIKASWTVASKIREYFKGRKEHGDSFGKGDYDDDYRNRMRYY